MELKEFVKESLSQIMEGIIEAQELSVGKKYIINPYPKKREDVYGTTEYSFKPEHAVNIDFEVVLTNTDANKGKGGIGVFLGGVGVGVQNDKEENTSNMTKIKFSIPVILPGNKDKSKVL